jgi:hypothetical protein
MALEPSALRWVKAARIAPQMARLGSAITRLELAVGRICFAVARHEPVELRPRACAHRKESPRAKSNAVE